MKFRNLIRFMISILSNRGYFLTFLLVSLGLFAVLYKFTLFTVADNSLGILTMMSSVNYVFLDLFLLAIISILFGIFVSLMVYKIKMVRQISKTGFLGTLGLTVGLFSAGCPTCGAFLFSLIGMPLALMYFPFGGLELKVLSILLIFLSIYFLVKSLIECKVDLKVINRRNG